MCLAPAFLPWMVSMHCIKLSTILNVTVIGFMWPWKLTSHVMGHHFKPQDHEWKLAQNGNSEICGSHIFISHGINQSIRKRFHYCFFSFSKEVAENCRNKVQSWNLCKQQQTFIGGEGVGRCDTSPGSDSELVTYPVHFLLHLPIPWIINWLRSLLGLSHLVSFVISSIKKI